MAVKEVSENCIAGMSSPPSLASPVAELTSCVADSILQVVEDSPVSVPGANGEMEEIVSLTWDRELCCRATMHRRTFPDIGVGRCSGAQRAMSGDILSLMELGRARSRHCNALRTMDRLMSVCGRAVSPRNMCISAFLRLAEYK